ncbi:type IV pilus assembly protein PilM [Candidatus Parcubacteria bacterium]|nr:type IV pilus assembly protein PilM [Candidatus Parcubacteria bacterium]
MGIFPFSQKCVGIDIGTSAIKILELSSFGGKVKLENFGIIFASSFLNLPYRTSEKNILSLPVERIVEGIEAVFEEAGMNAKQSFFSVPDFASFFTYFELPPMPKEELSFAIKAETRRHVPLPLSEVSVDWRILNPKTYTREPAKIVAIAIPNETLNQFEILSAASKIKILGLEPEVFSLARVFGKEPGVFGLLDIGAKTTSCSIIENGIVRASFTLDIAGETLTERLAKGLGISFEEAENLKRQFGITNQKEEVRKVILPFINSLIGEAERIFENFWRKEKKEVEKIILTGGSAKLPGLAEYFKLCLKKETEIGDPFKYISFPPILAQRLKIWGPILSVSVGLALAGLKK